MDIFNSRAPEYYTLTSLIHYPNFLSVLISLLHHHWGTLLQSVLLIPSTVPGSVENLTATFAAETSYDDISRTLFLVIEIAWDPPSNTSGIISGHGYSLQETDGTEFVILRTNTTSTAIEQNVTVAPYTNYTVAVLAFTAGGDGPEETVIILSPEAGNYAEYVNIGCVMVTSFPDSTPQLFSHFHIAG